MEVCKRLCHPTNYRKGRPGGVAYLVVHYVGAEGGAEENAAYYGATPGLEASAHYFVGHGPVGAVWASVPEGDTAWHVGAKKYLHPDCRNENSIGVELCCHMRGDGSWYFDPETVDAAAELCREIAARYAIPRERVLRHYDVTGKVCPAPFVRDPSAWREFLDLIFAKEGAGMNKCMMSIPVQEIRAMALVKGNGDSAGQIRATLRCDAVINGGLYDSTGPVCHLKSDGQVLAKDPWGYIGLGWNTGADIRELAIPEEGGGVQNYIACVQLTGRNMGEGDRPSYPAALGGRRGRSAIALAGESVILLCTRDGSAEAMTPEALQAELRGMGATAALMLDGGGSSQCTFGQGGEVTAARRVDHYLCVWTESDVVGRYEVTTKADPLTIRATPTTAGRKVGQYDKGTAVTVLAEVNGWGRTALGWCSMAYLTKLAETPASPIPPTPEEAAPWAQPSWLKAYAGGLMDGTRPTEPISRQEVAVLLDRLGWLGGDW